jgi:tetratricopeptide (TPR) repeat protein
MVSIDLLSSSAVSSTSPDMAIEYYRQAIAADERNYSYYWQLGIVYLHSGNLAEAQSTWFLPFMMEGVDSDYLVQELALILDTEAQLASQREEWQISRELRYAIREIQPDNFRSDRGFIRILFSRSISGRLSRC